MNDLERVSHAAYRSFYGERSREVGAATCLRLDEAADSPMMNRVVGLGLDDPATDEELEAALSAMEGVACYVAVSPFAAPADLALRLADRGLEPGWGWMLFARDASPPPPVETGLQVVEVDGSTAEPWARIVTSAYGLPDECAAIVAGLTAAPGWTAFVALDGDEPVAAAALWAQDGSAYLGFAGTLPEHRGKGGQGALFAARIEHARELGCTRLVTETGEQIPDRPSDSYRNILRFGFEEQFVVANRLRRRDA